MEDKFYIQGLLLTLLFVCCSCSPQKNILYEEEGVEVLNVISIRNVDLSDGENIQIQGLARGSTSEVVCLPKDVFQNPHSRFVNIELRRGKSRYLYLRTSGIKYERPGVVSIEVGETKELFVQQTGLPFWYKFNMPMREVRVSIRANICSNGKILPERLIVLSSGWVALDGL